ncbi:MAG: hypothetical protein ABSG84_06910 [Acidobacteriaceae bacterium]
MSGLPVAAAPALWTGAWFLIPDPILPSLAKATSISEAALAFPPTVSHLDN